MAREPTNAENESMHPTVPQPQRPTMPTPQGGGRKRMPFWLIRFPLEQPGAPPCVLAA
jgi:hypothetical protein